MLNKLARLGLAVTAFALTVSGPAAMAETTLLNVSYDVARELYKEINPAFVTTWKKKAGEEITVNQSHDGSSKQAMAVVNGLEADVVTMNQATDIDLLAERGLVTPEWRKRFPNNAAPYRSTTIFLVRKGNPKNIRDWNDLAKPGVAVVIANPKTAGNGRYSYLAAWGYALKSGKNEAQAREFVGQVFKNAPALAPSGRAATTMFTQRAIGDVLVTFENEVWLIDKEIGGGQFEAVYPSWSIDAEAPVAIVDKVADKRDTRKQAQAYLEFLYSPEGQEIIAKHYLRPSNEAVLKKNASRFKPIKLFTVDEVFGGWAKAQKTHFADGGIFDQVVSKQ